MPLKDFARSLRDGIIPRERLRRANPQAVIASGVTFAGDAGRTRLGAEVFVAGPSVLFVTDGGGLSASRLEVGERTYIGEFANIRCAGTPIKIGRHCLIGQQVSIVGSNHGIDPGTPIVDQPWHGEGVLIGDDVWIGAGSVVLPGARIGDGCVVAARSVVRGEIPPGSIVAGAPAKLIRRRDAIAAPTGP
ncbi:acyltransferase [Gephyromycinifex aptenodytis]|uniref:acyltransferase n=1 Tax=Gephyromycinifex aptenodytis TaxID=2716227 RepID=UPI00144585FD|nr:acyltransferase [Gephyromycinifex aptenodytis]